jgi:hypothetical protein
MEFLRLRFPQGISSPRAPLLSVMFGKQYLQSISSGLCSEIAREGDYSSPEKRLNGGTGVGPNVDPRDLCVWLREKVSLFGHRTPRI